MPTVAALWRCTHKTYQEPIGIVVFLSSRGSFAFCSHLRSAKPMTGNHVFFSILCMAVHTVVISKDEMQGKCLTRKTQARCVHVYVTLFFSLKMGELENAQTDDMHVYGHKWSFGAC
jgi:hypothetical protein